MTQDAFRILSFFFAQCWRFFNSLLVPGTNLTVSEFLFLSLFIGLIVRFVKSILSLNLLSKNTASKAPTDKSGGGKTDA